VDTFSYGCWLRRLVQAVAFKAAMALTTSGVVFSSPLTFQFFNSGM
jgi:hypothetical protein